MSCIIQRFDNKIYSHFFDWFVCNLAYVTSPINEILNLIFYGINRYFLSSSSSSMFSSSYATSSMSSTSLTSPEVDGLETHAPLLRLYLSCMVLLAVNCFLSYETKEETLFRSKIIFIVVPSFLQSNIVFFLNIFIDQSTKYIYIYYVVIIVLVFVVLRDLHKYTLHHSLRTLSCFQFF